MLSLSPGVRIFVYSRPTDMRRQFDGLRAIVTQAFGKDVFDGDYFVFFNRRQQLCKILYWDRDGLALWCKRLERGRFQLPAAGGEALSVEIDSTALAMILGGVDLKTAKRRPRYQAGSQEAVPSPASRRCVEQETFVSTTV